MSEHSVTIVDVDVSLADAPAVAERMLAWLQSEGIVSEGVREGDLYRDWLLSIGSDVTRKAASELAGEDRIVYRPGPNVLSACDLAARLDVQRNWLEVDVARQVFHAGEHGIGIQCASCGADQTERSETGATRSTTGTGAATARFAATPATPSHRCETGRSIRLGVRPSRLPLP